MLMLRTIFRLAILDRCYQSSTKLCELGKFYTAGGVDAWRHGPE